MTRPLRMMFVGDVTYPSLYRLGIRQASEIMGLDYSEAPLKGATSADLDAAVRSFDPDVIWSHMLLWPPEGRRGGLTAENMVALAEGWRRTGAVVVLHDGDPRPATRFPHDVSAAVDLALCNHNFDRAAWGVPSYRWPYGSLVYKAMARPGSAFEANLAFCGHLRDTEEEGAGADLYDARTACLRALREEGVLTVFPRPGEPNTLERTPEVAASASAVIGFGRPEVPGWIDTRVFQYPGAGAVLLHDDPGTYQGVPVLLPWAHYVPVKRYDVGSILKGLAWARGPGQATRIEAFNHVQQHHTCLNRVRWVLDLLDFRVPSGAPR